MKYIRTNDGIMTYENWERTNIAIEEHNNKPSRYIKLSMCKLDIINQADTIEELCDEFVVIGDFDKALRPYTHLGKDHPRLSNLKWYREECNYKKEIVVYGAIWTDKGLIYVARVNDKRELELL